MDENGGLYGYIDNPYPCGIFRPKGLGEIDFATVTIFYGGNGSGKSTLLNLISSKLELNRIAPFNSSETFDLYLKNCNYRMGFDDEGFQHRIPNGSRIITSDDVFDYMLTVRTNNNEISENKEEARADYGRLKYAKSIQMKGMEDYESFRLQVMARQKSVSRRKFIRKAAGEEVKLNSNGETALAYFNTRLHNDTLYCLDEPENSLSPKLQMELVKIIEEMAHYCDCQFIIATHSPFLLAMESAKIYDLDTNPVEIRKWWELENTKIYYEFFKKHKKLFEQ
jgi:predicted ATPase